MSEVTKILIIMSMSPQEGKMGGSTVKEVEHQANP